MTEIHSTLSRRQMLGLAGTGLALIAVPALAAAPAMITWRDPGCGCCTKWVEAMRKAGFAVTMRETGDMATVKSRLKVLAALQSCHTTVVGGLVVEGHVPAAAIRSLLARRPKGVLGIAAPGMPRGSPGMEMPDGSKDPLNLTLFDGVGNTRAFA
ncbi:DUF411 domain-containing protein [Sphingomonas kaistensis]|uniref:DUF411 domain-containing protein n=1 Tax=Sphingomonas kaistensis TaxID=298708 RepID=A0ABZ2FYX9_9SPHN